MHQWIYKTSCLAGLFSHVGVSSLIVLSPHSKQPLHTVIFLINKILSLQIDLTSKDIHAARAAIAANVAAQSVGERVNIGILAAHHGHEA